ncbi:MAG: MFS transporter [Planctomycetota bacterium]|nr:MFS transporter [Planctomycetota bacterium]
MSWSLYISLSAMMFLEYAVWGAWMPVLAPRLLGPLKMTGKQCGWIFATLPLACIVAPMLAGQVADKWLNTEWLLAGAHLAGAVLLFVAAKQEKFTPMFVVMLLYSMCYAATMPLVNSLMFAQLAKAVPPDEVSGASAKVFIMAPIAWALIGYLLTGWRQVSKTEGGAPDGFVLGGLLSVVMGVVCLFLPATPPAGGGESAPMFEALALLRDGDFLVFIVISMVLAGMMQFYFMGTGAFMQDIGISGKNVSGAMGMAQAAQAIATLFALGVLLDQLDKISPGHQYKWSLVIGAASWLGLYVIYVFMPRPAPVVVCQAFHGVAYVTFMIAGQVYAGQYAPKEIGGSVQALIFAATTGVGLFLATQLVGFVMDRNNVQGKLQWRNIWLVPLGIMAAGVIALIVGFQGNLPDRGKPAEKGAAVQRSLEQAPQPGPAVGSTSLLG